MIDGVGVLFAGAERWLSIALSLHHPAYEPTVVDYFLDEQHEVVTRSAFTCIGFMSVTRWRFHVTIATCFDRVEDGWRRGYPHVHHWPGSATLVQFLEAPRSGGELIIMPDGVDPIEVTPEPGLSVFCSGVTSHGVRPVREGRRVAFVATGWA